MEVNSFVALEEALLAHEDVISITRSMTATHSIILPPNTTLEGKVQENGMRPLLMFERGDGVGVMAANEIKDLVIQTPITQRAVFNAGYTEKLGHFEFSHLMVSGQFSFIMRDMSQSADIKMDDVHVFAADTRDYLEQPQKYGVNVLQGALTIYNFNPDPESLITVSATNIAIGAKENPVVGSGIFIAGFGDKGGRVEVELLETTTVYSTGRLPAGIADIITAAVFIVDGVHAKEVIHTGETVTYGVNDMVLDAWGMVDHWLAKDRVTSYGPSGIGFVNFGTVKLFEAEAPIETYGLGARGYNQYDGTLKEGRFHAVRTFGDGSVGVQISKHVGKITIDGGIHTKGGVGNSLVKGVNMELPAYALSVKDGGDAEAIEIKGDLSTEGTEVTTLHIEEDGHLSSLAIDGQLLAEGEQSQRYTIEDESLKEQLNIE